MIEDRDQLDALLGSIEMLGTRFEEWRFGWKVTPVIQGTLQGWHIQCSFDRPDVSRPAPQDLGGPVMTKGYGRKWLVERGASDTSVVFTAWLAIQQIIIHELHESFIVEVDGERVRLLDPHKELADLAHGSRRV
jgi:hypothetical protein